MNKQKIDELIKKYEVGNSSLSDEHFLTDNAEQLNHTTQAWFKFIKLNKKAVPKNFNDKVWESIQTKVIKKRRLRIGIMSAAASVILLISISIYNPWNKKQSYKKKEALLSEALSMFENANHKLKPEQHLIYEDDMIIIYTAVE